METIILKIILCSGIVLGLYYLFLAKEKTLTFNRFYLLLGLIFSYTIPFVTIETKEIVKDKPVLLIEQEIPQQILQDPATVQTETFDYTQLLLIIYFVISGILIAKMIYSILKIKTLKGRKIIYHNRNVVLLEKEIVPFSFLSTIYLSEKYFKDQKIDERIFLHEEIHVKQKHSFDVLLIEIIKAFSWFNPFIYFYKNVMITNHEFLADEEVIIKNENIKNYQELILNEVLKQQNLQLTHQFNFNNTKKRFIMMTKTNSKFAKAKKYLAIPAFAVLAVLFAERVSAKDDVGERNHSKKVSNSNNQSSNHTEAYEQFIKILEKYDQIIKDQDYEKFSKEVPREEQVKLADLYREFNFKDITETPIHVTYAEIHREIPTSSQLNKFLDSKYNITLDGKVVENRVLKNYKNTDFYSVYILKVIPTNPDYGKYDYGVVLYTNSYAKKYNATKNISVGFKTKKNDLYLLQLKKDTITPKTTVQAELVEVKEGGSFDEDVTVTKDLGTTTIQASTLNNVDTLPEYPGGINAMRQKVSSVFNGAVLKGDEGLLKSEITFLIDEKGEVSNIKTNGNNEIFNTESFKAVKLANENIKWKPATKNGQPVRYRFKLPLTMKFETHQKTQ